MVLGMQLFCCMPDNNFPAVAMATAGVRVDQRCVRDVIHRHTVLLHARVQHHGPHANAEI